MPASDPLSLHDVLARADLWRGDALAQGMAPGWPSGYSELDAALPGGGWPRGALVEMLLAAPGGLGAAGVGEISLLLPALARHTREGGFAALIAPPYPAHAPAWAGAGVELSRLVVVAPTSGSAVLRDALWAGELALGSGAVGFVLLWLAQAEAAQLRRLQGAAQRGGACAVVFRPAHCAAQPSPAPLRLLVSGSVQDARVAILKRRGAPLAHPLPVPVARPRAAARCAPAPVHRAPCPAPAGR